MSELLSGILAGIATGGIYALVGMSYSLVFRTTSVFNFAQGDFVMVATFMGYALGTSAHLPMGLVLVIVAIMIGLLGVLVDIVAVLPAIRVGDTGISWLISTLGVSLILESIMQHAYGSNPLVVPNIVSAASHQLGQVTIPSFQEMLPIIVAIILAGAFWVFRRKTIAGLTFDATAEDPQAAELRKIDTRRLGLLTFFLGGVIAGITGIVAGPTTFASYSLGASLAVYGFLAMAIGGFGHIPGALVGGLIVGLVFGISGLYIGSGYESSVMLGVLTVIFLIRPTGLFGSRNERYV